MSETNDPTLGSLRADAGRYALTKLHTDQRLVPGRQCLGLWKPPLIRLTKVRRHAVRASDIGRIDLIAWDYYRDCSLWWVIARVNRIQNPLTDLVVGQCLVIPDAQEIATAFVRALPEH
jgi:hypothetical protein